MFDHIVPCGIRDRGVTSMAALLGAAPPMRRGHRRGRRRDGRAARRHDGRAPGHRVATRRPTTLSAFSRGEALGAADAGSVARAARRRRGRGAGARSHLPAAGVDEGQGEPRARLPRDPAADEGQRAQHGLPGSGCPNIFECWADRTATFMILGERCTRACGFCLVDTRKPGPPDVEEPARLAEAVVAARARARGRDERRPRRSRRRWGGRVRRDDRGGAAPDAGGHDRGAHPGLQGRAGRARRDLRGPARRAEPQPRDRRPAAARGAPVGGVPPVARAPRSRQRRRAS